MSGKIVSFALLLNVLATSISLQAAVVTEDNVRLREQASSFSKILMRLEEGQEVEILEDGGGKWVRVKTADGAEGYLYRNYLLVEETGEKNNTETGQVSSPSTKETVKDNESQSVETKSPQKSSSPLPGERPEPASTKTAAKSVPAETPTESKPETVTGPDGELAEIFERAQKLNFEKKYKECLELLDQIIRRDPENSYGYTSRARFGKGVCFMGLKDVQKSNIAFMDYIRKYPEDTRVTEAYYYIILNYFEVDLEQAGKKKLFELIDGYPDSKWTKAAIDFVAGAYYARKLKNLENAEEIIGRYIEKHPEGRFEKEMKFQMAMLLKVQRSFRRAEHLFRSVAKADPGSALAFRAEDELVDMFIQLRDYDAALDYLKSLKAPDPNRQAVIDMNLAQVYYLRNEIEESITLFENIIQKFPDSSIADNAMKSLANVYFLRKFDYDRTIDYYTRILEKFPKGDVVPDALFGLGTAYFMKGELNSALKYFERFNAEYPARAARLNVPDEIQTIKENLAGDSRPFLIYISGLDAERRGDFETSRELYAEVLKRYPAASVVKECLYKMAASFIFEKRYDQAVPFLKKVSEDYPDSPYGKDARKKLQAIASLLAKEKK